jgi:flagellar protein FliS
MIDPYKNYKNISINTMAKGELLILLFDKLVQRLTLATILYKDNKIEDANINLNKSRDIFNYLLTSLDHSYGLSKDLSELYAFFNAEIIKAVSKKDISLIEQILPMIRELRDTWVEAEKLSKKNK